MKRIYFNKNIKTSIFTKKFRYKISECDGKKYISNGYAKFEIVSNKKTQFRQIIIIEGNAIDFLKAITNKVHGLKFLFEKDVEALRFNNLLYDYYEKDIDDYYDASMKKFNYMIDRMMYYNCNY